MFQTSPRKSPLVHATYRRAIYALRVYVLGRDRPHATGLVWSRLGWCARADASVKNFSHRPCCLPQHGLVSTRTNKETSRSAPQFDPKHVHPDMKKSVR